MIDKDPVRKGRKQQTNSYSGWLVVMIFGAAAKLQICPLWQAEAGILHANLQLTEDMAMGCYLYAMTPEKKTGYVP
eukprot:scaffold461675_cov50-Prasinocladus_malaysianus.AAC.1